MMQGGEVQLQPPDLQKLSDSAPLLGNSPSSSSASPSASGVAGSSDEINAEEDLESGASSAPCCRICLENDSDLLGDELISPCMCKGTQQFVHRSCLDHWRSVKEGFAFSHCTTCKAQFHLRVEPFEDNNSWRRKVKFRLFVARDVLLVFFAVQTVSIYVSLSLSLSALLHGSYCKCCFLRMIKRFIRDLVDNLCCCEGILDSNLDLITAQFHMVLQLDNRT